MTYFRNFQTVFNAAAEVYDKHLPVKAESWSTCELNYLRDKLDEEYSEVAEVIERRKYLLDLIKRYLIDPNIRVSKELSGLLVSEYKELLDLINVSAMLAKRLQDVAEVVEKDGLMTLGREV